MAAHTEFDHYGVKGMRWGRRKDREKSSASTQSAEAKKARNKKRAMIAAGVVTGLVASYAAYTLVDSGEARRLATKGAAFLSKQQPTFKRNESLAKQMSVDDIMSKVVSDINPDYGKVPGTVNNCRRCTFAYIMRRKGYDVTATRSIKGRGQSLFATAIASDSSEKKGAYATGTVGLGVRLFKDSLKIGGDVQQTKIFQYQTGRTAAEKTLNSKLANTAKERGWGMSLVKTLSTEPNGSMGEVEWQWNNRSGHSMVYEIINNKPVIIDAQRGVRYSTDTAEGLRELAKLGLSATKVKLRRLDDADLNTDFLMRWVKNADD